METPLLATKLFVPPAPQEAVQRPRLIDKLNGALSNRLVLVCAPAGFGKTTLVSQWLQAQQPPIPAAWLSLEDTDNDAGVFWEYILAALRTVGNGAIKTSASLARFAERLPNESIIPVLINDVASVSSDFVLVLDDYQFIQSEAIHRGIAFFLEHMPPKMHLIIATRVDPPLPLARFRGKGMMMEVRADSLRFTDNEAREFAARARTTGLSEDHIDTLNAKAEGWAVGLKMAILSLHGETDAATFVSRFAGSQKYIMDYLMDEVLERLPAEEREFLLKTSILERLNPALCDAVTGRDDSDKMLLDLERSNLFLVPLDTTQEWYRYHHLFRDLLRHRLRTEIPVEIAKDLNLRASRWYEANGLPEDAIDHALSAQDWRKALDIIKIPEVSNPRLRSPTMLKWLQQIPEETLCADTKLCLRYAWALEGTGDFAHALKLLDYLEGLQERDNRLSGQIAVARGALAVDQGDFGLAQRYLEKGQILLENTAESRGGVGDRGALASRLAGVALRRGQVLKAEPLMRAAYEDFRRIGDLRDAGIELTYLGVAQELKGKLHEAARTLNEAIELIRDDPIAADAHLYLGEVHYLWNDLAEALAQERQSLALMPFPGTSGGATRDLIYLHLARTAMAAGDPDEASRNLEAADRLLAAGDPLPTHRWRNAAFHAAVSLIGGEMESALRWADAVDDRFVSLPANVILLRCLARGRPVAEVRLREGYDQSVHASLWGMAMAVRITQAIQSDDPDEAMAFLSEALKMGHPEGYIRTFVDFGMALAPLLRRSLRAHIEPEYSSRLLDTIEAEERQRKIRRGELSPTADITALSERELEVLRLLAEGLTNQNIADRLVISLQTAKTHVRHIFDKLGVGGRTLAIARAKELGLFGSSASRSNPDHPV